MYRNICKKKYLLLLLTICVSSSLFYYVHFTSFNKKTKRLETNINQVIWNLTSPDFTYGNISSVLNELNELDALIRTKVPESEIFGNIYSGKATQQLQGYITAIKDFNKKYPIRNICEIGFAGGHSATVFLYTVYGESYTAFDKWENSLYEDASLTWIKNKFSNRQITIIKGDSTKTVPKFKGECDVIHIDGAHHANFPQLDTINMMRIASVNNLLLIDDCTNSWPSVTKAVKHLIKNDLVYDMKQYIATGWSHRGSQKGWCIGHYKKTWSINQFVQNSLNLFSYKQPFLKSFGNFETNSFVFLNKEFCMPSWQGQECEEQIYTPCSKLSDECFYNDQSGVLAVSCDRWHKAQRVKNLAWDYRDRNIDINNHIKSINYHEILPFDLGDVIEIGAGPFTQSKSILRNKIVSSITLLEPMAFHYINHVGNCFYKTGSFESLPTTILAIPANELLNHTRKYDTVVMINGIKNVYDALNLLNIAVTLLKENGVFIWHERLWDDYRGIAKSPDDREFHIHPLRIKSIVAKQVMTMFEELFLSWDTNSRTLKNEGVYFIGQKLSKQMTSNIPEHDACFDRNEGKQTIIFFISNSNYTFLTEEIKMADQSVNTQRIILIQTESMNTNMSHIFKFTKVQILISHQHLPNWESEIKHYASPCVRIHPHLTSVLLNSFDTVCVGTNAAVTLVLMGYSTKRLPNYEIILQAYAKMDTINQIILIWNNKNEPFLNPYHDIPITFITPEENSMNNRFNVSEHLHTDAVLIVDDDVLLNEALISLILYRWIENTDRLFGLDGRFVLPGNKYSGYGRRHRESPLVIGKTMLFHRKYLEQYMNDQALVEWNRPRFCEDISMNALIFNATKLKPIIVQMNDHCYRTNLPEVDGLSIAIPANKWIDKRSICVQWVSEYFNIKF